MEAVNDKVVKLNIYTLFNFKNAQLANITNVGLPKMCISRVGRQLVNFVFKCESGIMYIYDKNDLLDS